MSEHWKSTPKYWCKHCSCFVRDTRLERQQHESTFKHQNAIKRSLRNLHRNHEREEREHERARNEIDRLNSIIKDSVQSQGFTSPAKHHQKSASSQIRSSERDSKRLQEQEADLGVVKPGEGRQAMALIGEWESTKLQDTEQGQDDSSDVKSTAAKAAAIGTRAISEDDREESDFVERLFKKPRTWGRDPRIAPAESDTELDVLLNSSFPTKSTVTKVAKSIDQEKAGQRICTDEERHLESRDVAAAEQESIDCLGKVKTEERVVNGGLFGIEAESKNSPRVSFKKRKLKQARQG